MPGSGGYSDLGFGLGRPLFLPVKELRQRSFLRGGPLVSLRPSLFGLNPEPSPVPDRRGADPPGPDLSGRPEAGRPEAGRVDSVRNSGLGGLDPANFLGAAPPLRGRNSRGLSSLSANRRGGLVDAPPDPSGRGLNGLPPAAGRSVRGA